MIKLVKNDFFIYCKEARIESNRSFYGSFRLGPFDAGQSITIANALRRTLLSELKGLAITSAEIEGAFHEYSTLPGVRDSILDILLNLKDIVLKAKSVYFVTKAPSLKDQKSPRSVNGNNKRGTSYGATFKKEQIGYLKTRGPGIVKASSLRLPPGIQCVDPDQYIATLSEEGVLNIKFNINEGKNYVIQTYKNNQSKLLTMNSKDLSVPLIKSNNLGKVNNNLQKCKKGIVSLLKKGKKKAPLVKLTKKGNVLTHPPLLNEELELKPKQKEKNKENTIFFVSPLTFSKSPPERDKDRDKDRDRDRDRDRDNPDFSNRKQFEKVLNNNDPLILSFSSLFTYVGKQGALRQKSKLKPQNPLPQRGLETLEALNKNKTTIGVSETLEPVSLRPKQMSLSLKKRLTLKPKRLDLPDWPQEGLTLYKRRRLWLKKLNLINTFSFNKSLKKELDRFAKKSLAFKELDASSNFINANSNNNNNLKTNLNKSESSLKLTQKKQSDKTVPQVKKEKLRLLLSVATPLCKKGIAKQKPFLQKKITVFQKNYFFMSKENFLRNQEREDLHQFLLKKKRIRSLDLSLHLRSALTSLKAVSLSIDAVFMPVNKVNYIIEINEQSVMSKVTKPSSFLEPLKPTTSYFNPGEKLHRNPLFLNQPLCLKLKLGLASEGYFINKAGLATALSKKQILLSKDMPSLNSLNLSLSPLLKGLKGSPSLMPLAFGVIKGEAEENEVNKKQNLNQDLNKTKTAFPKLIKAKIKPSLTIFAPKRNGQTHPERSLKAKTLRLPLSFGLKKSNGFRVSNEQTTSSLKNNIILEIWTNGSIHPRQALYEACKNLLSVFSKLEKATPLI